MAHKKALGSAKKNRDSISKRLGVKIYGGQNVKKGEIIIRQRGSKYRAGDGVFTGKDYTLHASINGIVKFQVKKIESFAAKKKTVNFVSVSN